MTFGSPGWEARWEQCGNTARGGYRLRLLVRLLAAERHDGIYSISFIEMSKLYINRFKLQRCPDGKGVTLFQDADTEVSA